MALLLYAATAAGLLWLTHRYVLPLGWRSAAILFLLPFCFTGRAMLTGAVYAPIDLPYLTEPLRDMRAPLGVPVWHNGLMSDLYAQMIPWRKAVQYSLAHRQWPLWNPFLHAGSILAASAQPAAYSPFTLLACLLPIADGLTYSAAITLFIAALGAFLFARDAGLTIASSNFAAAGFMMSFAVVFWVLWAVGVSWSFLPLVLLGARRCVHRPGIASATLLMIALALLVLSGHPETVVHAVFVGAVYGVFELARARQRTVAAIVSAAAAGVIALLLTAIYILPILEVAPQSADYIGRRELFAQQPHGVDAQESALRMVCDIFPFVAAMEWRIPRAGIPPLDSCAVGSVILALAAYAVLRLRRAEVGFFLALAIFGFLARAGWAPLANTIQHLPLFAMTITERFSFAAAFAFVMLAAFGFEEIVRRRGDAFAVYVIFAAVLFFTAGTWWLRATGMVALKSFPEFGHYAEFACIAGIGAAGLAAIWRPAWLLPVMIAQRVITGFDVYPTLPKYAAYPPIAILQPALHARPPFRIVAQHWGFIPGTSTLYELEDVRGYEALTLDRFKMTYPLWCVDQSVWFNRVDDLSKPFLSFLNVKYAITTADPPPGWHTVATQDKSRLVENERVLPRAFVPAMTTVGSAELIDHTLEDMQSATDFRQRAWIEAPQSRHEEHNGPGTVTQIEPRGTDGFRIRVTMERAGRVVVSEPAWKGWRAYVDGRRVQMQIANLAFLAIYVPAGAHTIRLVYLPDAFVAGRAISLTTLGALLILALVLRWRDRRYSNSRQNQLS